MSKQQTTTKISPDDLQNKLQAFQDGDAWTLPALPVAATFNASAPVVVRYRPAARTLLRDGRTTSAGNYVLGNP